MNGIHQEDIQITHVIRQDDVRLIRQFGHLHSSHMIKTYYAEKPAPKHEDLEGFFLVAFLEQEGKNDWVQQKGSRKEYNAYIQFPNER